MKLKVFFFFLLIHSNMDDFPICEKKDSQDYLSYTSLEHEGTYDDDLFDFSEMTNQNDNNISKISSKNKEISVNECNDEISSRMMAILPNNQYFINFNQSQLCRTSNSYLFKTNMNNKMHLSYNLSMMNKNINQRINMIPIKQNRKQKFNLTKFPQHIITISKDKHYKIYDYLYQITGAYLTQKELLFLRKTIFKKVLPQIQREEQRYKLKNIQCIEDYYEKIIPIIKNPDIQTSIQNYVFNRRQNFERIEMLYNISQL